jgi:hypothetical protein
LGIRETGFICGVFHAPTEAALKMNRPTPDRMSTHPSNLILIAINQPAKPQRLSEKLIIQTDSNNSPEPPPIALSVPHSRLTDMAARLSFCR